MMEGTCYFIQASAISYHYALTFCEVNYLCIATYRYLMEYIFHKVRYLIYHDMKYVCQYEFYYFVDNVEPWDVCVSTPFVYDLGTYGMHYYPWVPTNFIDTSAHGIWNSPNANTMSVDPMSVDPNAYIMMRFFAPPYFNNGPIQTVTIYVCVDDFGYLFWNGNFVTDYVIGFISF